MSFFDLFSSEESDASVGKRVLEGFFNEAANFSEFQFSSDFEAWLTYLKGKVSDIEELIGQLVKANYASTTIDQAIERVARLANTSSGLASIPDIVSAAGGRGDTVNWSAALPEIASESLSDAGAAIQNVGHGVLGTINMTKYLPFILLGAGALYIYVNSKALGLGRK
jgi:hypothetical protein